MELRGDNFMVPFDRLASYLAEFWRNARAAEQAVLDLLTALQDDDVVVQHLTELQHLLQRCQRTMATCNEQIGKCAKVRSSRVGRELRRQLEQEELDPELAKVFLGQVERRMGYIAATLRRFQELGTVEALHQEEPKIISLQDRKARVELMQMGAGAVRKTVAGLVMVGGVACLVCFCPPAVAAVVANGGVPALFQIATIKAAAPAVSQAITGFLCWGAAASIEKKIEKRARVLVPRLQQFIESYQRAFGQLREVDTLMHGINETKMSVETDLNEARQFIAPANRYEGFALQDAMETLLEGLGRLEGRVDE